MIVGHVLGYEGRVARTNVDDVALDLHRRGSRNVDDETGDVLVRTENGPGWLGELEHADKNRPRRKGSQATLDDAARISSRYERRRQQSDRGREHSSGDRERESPRADRRRQASKEDRSEEQPPEK